MGKGYVREAVEASSQGNEAVSPTLATKKLFPRATTFEFNPGFKHDERDDELLNTDEPVPVIPGSADPSWSSEGRMYPDAIGQWLTELLGDPVTTAGNGVITDPDTVTIPTGANKHVWTSPYGPAGALARTFEATQAYTEPEGVFYRGRGCGVQELSIENPASGGVQVKRSGPVLHLARISDPSLSPSHEANSIHPFLRSHMTLTWLAGSAKSKDFSLAFANPLEPEHNIGSGSRWPDELYKGDGPIVVSGAIPKQLIDPDDYDALKEAMGFAATVRWASTVVIASGYTYKLWVAMSHCQYVDGSAEALTGARRRGAQFQFKAARDSAAAVVVTLVNATTSYL